METVASSQDSPHASSSVASLSGVEILMAEDSLTQALKLQFLLEENGFRATVARDGRAAWEVLQQRAASDLPAMIITDVEMPQMSGYELCHHIKSDASLSALPVMLLTSLSDATDVVRGLECRADHFVVKPYDEEFLLSRIAYALSNRARVPSPTQSTLEAEKGAGIEVFLAGQRHVLSAAPDLSTTLDLLLGTYETAIQKNRELSRAREALEKKAAELAEANAILQSTTLELQEKNAHMQADLNLAREIQNGFILKQYPSFPHGVAPDRSALRFTQRWIPTTTLGGDFFDVLALSETQAGVFICDVMGHGVRSALVTAMLRALVGERTSQALDPGQFLGEINRHLIAILQQTRTPMFASAFYMIADVQNGHLTYANAGHPSPIFLSGAHHEGGADHEGGVAAQWLLSEAFESGPALGVFEEAVYETASRAMGVDDLVMMFTDGLVEVEGARDEGEWGEERLLHSVASNRHLAPGPLFDRILSEIRQFSGQPDFDDDVCLIGMRVDHLYHPTG